MSFQQSVIIAELWRSEVARRWKNFKFLHFFGKATLTGKVSKFCSKTIHRDTDPLVVLKFREIWPMGNRWSRALFTWQEKFRLVLQLWLLRRFYPKICPAQHQAMYWECSRFHPNRFTFGGVIPEHVNTIKTGCKMFPVFSWSLASSQIITSGQSNLT